MPSRQSPATSRTPTLATSSLQSPTLPRSQGRSTSPASSASSRSVAAARSRSVRAEPTRSRAASSSRSSRAHLQSMLEILEDREEARLEELNRYSDEVDVNNTEPTSTCTIFDGIYRDGGTEAVLTNFSPSEINTLWFSVRGHVHRYWNVGRGRRSTFAAKDVFFMLLVVFKVKTPTFIKAITGFIEVVTPKLYEEWVTSQLDVTTKRALVTSGHTFNNFPCAFAKHKLYGFKVEVSVNPRGLAINCIRHARGNTADITVFRNNQAFHQQARRKAEENQRLPDNGPLHSDYPEEWAVLADKGYQGLDAHLRCIHPKKGNQLNPEEVRQNGRISSDRVIVENFFGRICGLWRVCAEKFRWSEAFYDDIFHICVSLTNYHVTLHPLREQNGTCYRQYQNRLLAIGAEMKKRRRLNQERYRRNQRLRHQMQLDDHPVHSDFEIGSDLSEAESDTTQMPR
ncbi:hypothetical protein F441_14581 [Phytophthora nicotianae CJ01A1]|uniref:DDE Tnp4 domain-containing protein n=4 Tax=Phytophthora nicotianae TaxID=4792 RepID=V9EKG3_PHYNI|nr:hypothetical protein F443_14723 [Phytophthora nicotianae P1569]ETP09608.1 hypothetical protein F441_14581 [Phytophthora nicotianae CJ01A1]